MAVLNPYNYKKPKMASMGINKKPAMVTSKGGQNKGGYNQSSNYLEAKIMSAKPEELTLMLYDGIVKFLKQSILFIEAKNIEKAHNTNLRAQAIIEELRATLNMDIEVSQNLEELYIYMNQRLAEANLSKNHEIIEEVVELAIDLRDTWKQAMNL